MQIEGSWGEVRMEDLGTILRLADGLVVEGHEGKVEAKMTHGFSA